MPLRAAEFRTLSAQEASRLKRQLKVYLIDYPGMSAEDLAELWHDDQVVLAADTWLAPYLAGSDWSREVPRVLLHLKRERDYKLANKAYRAQARERHLDRTPPTERQLAAIRRALERFPDLHAGPLEGLSRLAAARLLDAARQRRSLDQARPWTPDVPLKK